MAGTVAVTEETYGPVKKVRFDWVSDVAGQAGGSTTYAFCGAIIGLVTKPGEGAEQPDNLYDVLILDQDDIDVLAGAGGNRSNVDTEQVLAANLGVVVNDRLTLAVANAGSEKSGTVFVYIR